MLREFAGVLVCRGGGADNSNVALFNFDDEENAVPLIKSCKILPFKQRDKVQYDVQDHNVSLRLFVFLDDKDDGSFELSLYPDDIYYKDADIKFYLHEKRDTRSDEDNDDIISLSRLEIDGYFMKSEIGYLELPIIKINSLRKFNKYIPNLELISE